MKKFNKIFKAITIMAIAAVIFTLVACTPEKTEKPASKEITVNIVVIEDTPIEYKVTLKEKTNLIDAFVICAKENSSFTYSETDGMINKVNTLTSDSNKKEFVAIYTNAVKDGKNLFTETFGKTTYKGKEYFSASKGLKELPLVDGAYYIFAISTY